jgi:hypothetical protein
MMSGGKQSQPATQPAAIPEAPAKQADKTPEPDVFRQKNAAAAGAGAGSTLLSGPGGVADSLLALSKPTLSGSNTLLGA